MDGSLQSRTVGLASDHAGRDLLERLLPHLPRRLRVDLPVIGDGPDHGGRTAFAPAKIHEGIEMFAGDAEQIGRAHV